MCAHALCACVRVCVCYMPSAKWGIPQGFLSIKLASNLSEKQGTFQDRQMCICVSLCEHRGVFMSVRIKFWEQRYVWQFCCDMCVVMSIDTYRHICVIFLSVYTVDMCIHVVCMWQLILCGTKKKKTKASDRQRQLHYSARTHTELFPKTELTALSFSYSCYLFLLLSISGIPWSVAFSPISLFTFACRLCRTFFLLFWNQQIKIDGDWSVQYSFIVYARKSIWCKKKFNLMPKNIF